MKRLRGASWRDLTYDEHHPLWDELVGQHGSRLEVQLQILMTVSAIFIALGITHAAAVNAASKVE